MTLQLDDTQEKYVETYFQVEKAACYVVSIHPQIMQFPTIARVAMVQHALYHVVMGHLVMDVEKYQHGDEAFHIAADMVVNQMINVKAVMGECAKAGAMAPLFIMPEMIGLPADKSVGVYLELLPKDGDGGGSQQQQKQSDQQGQGQPQGGGQGKGHPGKNKFKAEDGQEPPKNKPASPSSGGNGKYVPKAAQKNRNAPEGPQTDSRRFDSFHGSSQMDEGQKILAQRRYLEIAKEVAQHTKMAGLVPADLVDQITPKEYKAVVRLGEMILDIGGHHRSDRRIYKKNRLNRRRGQPPASRRRNLPSVDFIIDTSGSMSNDDIAPGIPEIQNVYEIGCKLRVIDADAEVQQIRDYEGEESLKIKGRGGTCFAPALKFAADLDDPADFVVYWTDGYGFDMGDLPDMQMPVLFILTARGKPLEKFRHEVPENKGIYSCKLHEDGTVEF